jgi:hypothetical protein
MATKCNEGGWFEMIESQRARVRRRLAGMDTPTLAQLVVYFTEKGEQADEQEREVHELVRAEIARRSNEGGALRNRRAS